MSYLIERANNQVAALQDAIKWLKRIQLGGEVPTVLVPTGALKAHVRQALLHDACFSAVRVETLDAWVEDRWQLFGDGRIIVSANERTLLMRRSIQQVGSADSQHEEKLAPTPGVVDALAGLARDALGLIVGTNQQNEALSCAEKSILTILNYYESQLVRQGLCEMSDAACALPRVLEGSLSVALWGFDQVPCAIEYLLEALGERGEVVRFVDDCMAPDDHAQRSAELSALLGSLFSPANGSALEPTGAVRFLLPAGRYAANALIANEVLTAVLRERAAALENMRDALPVHVSCRKPATLFAQMDNYLASRDVWAATLAQTTFAQTAFGRAFLALWRFIVNQRLVPSHASDFVLSDFSGISLRASYSLDALWRSDRTITRERVLADISQASELAANVITALRGGDIGAALTVYEKQFRYRGNYDGAYCAEQRAALSAAQRLVQAGVACGIPALEMLDCLEGLTVSQAVRTAPLHENQSGEKTNPDVVFMQLSDAAQCPSCSCSTLVLCDLNTSEYSIRADENGATLLLGKLGLQAQCDPLTQARKQFFRALCSARDSLVCQRVLNTVDGEEAHPSVMYEELVDCYRADPTGNTDLDHITGLPTLLAKTATMAGEDSLQHNLALGNDEAQVCSWDVPLSGEVSDEARSQVMIARVSSGAEGDSSGENEYGTAPPLLSPSAIESYLECPGKWFSQRRLRLSELDAGFGPLEMGSFSHAVLKNFYEQFAKMGYVKVSPSNIEQAQTVLRDTFARHVAFQAHIKPSGNPLLPLSAFEQAELHALEHRLLAYLQRESALLPTFVPTYFEFDFGVLEPFWYGGCALRGSIDRIDVNDRGQAVVIDYKGSVSSDYAATSASPAHQAGKMMLPYKVQTLMYAQVVRRLLGFEVVGALYVSYGRKAIISGAFDRAVLGEESLPFVASQNCGIPGEASEVLGVSSFAQALDRVEEGVAAAVDSMARGIITPSPRGSDPCKFCPVFSCERRKRL